MRKYLYLGFAALAFWVILDGVQRFNAAKTVLELFKGLFWIAIGSAGTYISMGEYRQSKGKD